MVQSRPFFLQAFSLRSLLAILGLNAAALNVYAAAADTQRLGASTISAERTAPIQPALSALRYDFDYPDMNYAGTPTHNPVAELQARMDRGEVKLKFNARHGYLESFLQALRIDASSQTLVYSKTSLQIDLIRAATPRAIYFNDDTYVAWLQGTNFLEIVAMDSVLGPVFYTLNNHEGATTQVQRETGRCLSCHDTFSMMGGGVPRFLFMSTLVSRSGEALTNQPGTETSDETPLSERWGGWYVTGGHGNLKHLGNILVDSEEELNDPRSAPRATNLSTLAGLLDTRPYVTDKSDIVALLVFEHQAYVHNLITRANFKSRTVLARDANGEPVDTLAWKDLSPKTLVAMKAMLEPLVRAMLFAGAADMTTRITSSSGFDAWFQAQGPRDREGRSLRALDLNTRLFKYPMSFLIYSHGFNGLPACAKEYLYGRFADVLGGRDTSATWSHLSAADRKNLVEILTGTSPEFAKAARVRNVS